MIFTLLAGLELIEMYSFVLANKSCFPISNSILLTWVGWGGLARVVARLESKLARRWQTRWQPGGGRPAVANWFQVLQRVLFLDNFQDRSEILRNIFEIYRYSYTYFIEEEGNEDGSCNDDGDENDDDNDDGDDDNDEYYNDDDDNERDVSTMC